MPVGAIAGASIGGGLISSSASKKAAAQQANAANAATNLQRDIFDTNQENLKPFIQTGGNAMTSLASLYGIATPDNPNPGGAFGADAIKQFERSPDYGFAFDQGQKALQYSLGAKGLLKSGSALGELQKFGQGLASQNFNNYAQRLLSLSSLGSQAAGTAASTGTQAGIGMGSTTMAAGNALAGGTVGAANAINSSIGTGINNLMFYNQLGKSSYGTPNVFPGGQTMIGQMQPQNSFGSAPFYGVGSLPY